MFASRTWRWSPDPARSRPHARVLCRFVSPLIPPHRKKRTKKKHAINRRRRRKQSHESRRYVSDVFVGDASLTAAWTRSFFDLLKGVTPWLVAWDTPTAPEPLLLYCWRRHALLAWAWSTPPRPPRTHGRESGLHCNGAGFETGPARLLEGGASAGKGGGASASQGRSPGCRTPSRFFIFTFDGCIFESFRLRCLQRWFIPLSKTYELYLFFTYPFIL